MKLYSVIDIETTGFGKYDKIVEIGIVKMDENGNILDSYSTLVNPNRDVSATHIHGINATMVKSAPTFGEISHFVVEYLNGSIPVSHNKVFDFKFIEREVRDSGIVDYQLDGLCTLNLTRRIFPDLPCRKLSTLCECFDIDLDDAHSAFHDCTATAKLLGILIQESSYIPEILPLNYEIEKVGCERIEFTRVESDIAINLEQSKLSKLIASQPDITASRDYNVSEYLNLLDRILEDRIVTDEELETVNDYLSDFQLSSSAIDKIHEEYFRRLCSFYLNDKIISVAEAVDLDVVARLLGISQSTKNLILDLEKSVENREVNSPEESFRDKSVCFTGALVGRIDGVLIDRNMAHTMAIENGLMIKKSISKKLDYLVVADPNTNSGKAKKAREIGVSIIAEMVFWNKIGISAE